MKKKVLVMGGSYFIGRKIVEVLLQNDFEVTVLNRGSCIINNVHQLSCDRNDEGKLKSTLSALDFEYIIDVSGLNGKHAELLCNSINIRSLKKFIFISSSAVYDIDNLVIPFTESDNLNENIYWTLYGQEKIEAEDLYTQRFNNTDVKLIIIRPPYVYGEHNYAQRESFIFEHICNNKPVIIPISNPKLQFIFTSDLAYNVIDLINMVSENINIYNVGNTDYVNTEEWINLCASVVGKDANIIKFDYKAYDMYARDFFPFHDYDNVLDVSKIKRISNHETNLMNGLKAAFTWYLEVKNNLQFKDIVSNNEIKILEKFSNKLV